MRNPIIAALDVPNVEAALKLADQIAPAVGAFKIGGELFTAAGRTSCAGFATPGRRFFLT